MTTPVASTTDPTSSNSVLQNLLAQQAQEKAANAANAASGGSSSSLAQQTSVSTIGSNFNTFINILTTQLQHQDPTNATDPNQFTQELVQFAGVEQQLNTNNDLQTLINLQKNAGGVSAVLNYMGQFIQAPVTNGQFPLQNKQAEMAYSLSTPAQNVSIAVEDAKGQTLATLTGSGNSGMNYVTWNGQDSSGNQMPDGTYKFVITATNADGSTQTPLTTEVVGKVTGIATNSDGTTSLALGNMTISTAAVDAIFGPNNLPSATTSPGQPSS